jgi:hypothetical protein
LSRWLTRGLLGAALAWGLALGAGCQSSGGEVGYLGDARAMAALAAEPINAQPWVFAGNQGVLITTENYRIFTTVQDPLYQRLLTKVLESAHARAVAINPSGRVKKPLDCYVFASRSQWELYTNLHAGGEASTYLEITAGGYCRYGVFAGYNTGNLEQTLSVISHEAWHQYSWFAFKDHLPSWIEEGLATQNEGIDWEGAMPRIRPEMNYQRWFALKQAVRENRMWKISDMAATHAGRVIPLQQKQVDAYYAELWSLTLFLENSPRYRSGLARMLADADAGTLSKALEGTGVNGDGYSERWNTIAGPLYLRQYITSDLPGLQREYESWARSFTMTWPPQPREGMPD